MVKVLTNTDFTKTMIVSGEDLIKVGVALEEKFECEVLSRVVTYPNVEGSIIILHDRK